MFILPVHHLAATPYWPVAKQHSFKGGCWFYTKYNKIKTSHSGIIGSALGATEARDWHGKCITSDLLNA